MDVDSLIRQAAQPGQGLASVYLITGDDPLLTIEAADALRSAAKQAGFTERTSLVMDARSDWSLLARASGSGSLFGDKQLLEISIPTGKPGKQGADALMALAAQYGGRPGAEVVNIVSMPRLDRATRDSKWAQCLFDAATVLDLPNIDRPHLPAWIGQRLAKQGQQANNETLEWLADKVEGNLLAAHQEILKLGLLFEPGMLNLAQVSQAVLNVARYDVFGLRDAMLAGQSTRVLRILEGLKAEGEALPLVLWAVGEEIRLLARVVQLGNQGSDLGSAMRTMRIFGQHERLARQAIDRVGTTAWPAMVQHAHEIDKLIKGLQVPGRLHDPWQEMARLIMRVTLQSSQRKSR